ncbi:Translation initiation factor IF-2 [Dissostichus eleginoides]|uniref:Translation initiation factor IF-2 n=1 Tax=Dissostichus eleginoides TaxID=100907 RepID=A0AAD9F832_DISEL|nr:Translation initiation factor IF-2 [Dissostichus eleginoides]
METSIVQGRKSCSRKHSPQGTGHGDVCLKSLLPCRGAASTPASGRTTDLSTAHVIAFLSNRDLTCDVFLSNVNPREV